MNEHVPSLPATFVSNDPDRAVGEVFRRLAGIRATYGEPGLANAVRAVHAALGRAAHEEAEILARRLAERDAPAARGVRVSATARRVDADDWGAPGDL